MPLQWSHVDWTSVGEEAICDLQQLLRIDSSNPPGNEVEAADFVAERLREDGLEPTILTSAPDRVNVITRIEGSEDLAPLLLSAHLDVVPAHEDNWRYPPFAGERKEGFLWGRGAIDMKNMVVMSMWMMKLIKRMGQPKRTVIFAAVADEEAGCHYGSHWLVDHHPDQIRAGYMISELGGFTLHLMGKRFYPIQVAEKGQVELLMRTRGTKGHGSMPKRRSSNTKLAEAIAKIGKTKLPRHMIPIQQHFLNEVSHHLPFPANKLFPLLGTPLGEQLMRILPDEQSEPLDANMRNTVAATVLEAGGKGERNVIPGESRAWLDARIIPGQQPEDVIRELRAVIGDEPELEILDAQLPVWIDDYQDDLFGLMCEAIRRHDPEGIPVPYLLPGFTDAKAYNRLGIRCYGFAPLQLPKDVSFSGLFHNVNERIPVDGFQWGLKTLADVVTSFAGAR